MLVFLSPGIAGLVVVIFVHIELEFLVLKKISTVAKVKLFYVACSKNCFLPWTMEMIRGSRWLSFRSTRIREYLRMPYWLLFNVCPAIYAFPFKNGRAGASPPKSSEKKREIGSRRLTAARHTRKTR